MNETIFKKLSKDDYWDAVSKFVRTRGIGVLKEFIKDIKTVIDSKEEINLTSIENITDLIFNGDKDHSFIRNFNHSIVGSLFINNGVYANDRIPKKLVFNDEIIDGETDIVFDMDFISRNDLSFKLENAFRSITDILKYRDDVKSPVRAIDYVETKPVVFFSEDCVRIFEFICLESFLKTSIDIILEKIKDDIDKDETPNSIIRECIAKCHVYLNNNSYEDLIKELLDGMIPNYDFVERSKDAFFSNLSPYGYDITLMENIKEVINEVTVDLFNGDIIDKEELGNLSITDFRDSIYHGAHGFGVIVEKMIGDLFNKVNKGDTFGFPDHVLIILMNEINNFKYDHSSLNQRLYFHMIEDNTIVHLTRLLFGYMCLSYSISIKMDISRSNQSVNNNDAIILQRYLKIGNKIVNRELQNIREMLNGKLYITGGVKSLLTAVVDDIELSLSYEKFYIKTNIVNIHGDNPNWKSVTSEESLSYLENTFSSSAFTDNYDKYKSNFSLEDKLDDFCNSLIEESKVAKETEYTSECFNKIIALETHLRVKNTRESIKNKITDTIKTVEGILV